MTEEITTPSCWHCIHLYSSSYGGSLEEPPSSEWGCKLELDMVLAEHIANYMDHLDPRGDAEWAQAIASLCDKYEYNPSPEYDLEYIEPPEYIPETYQ